MAREDKQGGTEVVEKPQAVTKRPKLYHVVLLNDDYTTMEFVVHVLESVFDKGPAESYRIMMEVHTRGRGPGVTLLMVGINDAHYGYFYGTVFANVRALVGKTRAAGSSVVLATTTPVIDSGLRTVQYAHLRDVVNPAIRAVAAAAKVPLIDIWSYFARLPNWRTYIYAPQGNHLTDAGYDLVASRFLQALLKNDLALPPAGTARGPLLADVSLGVWDLPARGARTEAANAGAAQLVLDNVSPLADNGIVAAAPVDLDGDGIDSVAVVRARTGALSLAVHAAPPAGTLAPAAVLAAVTLEAEADWLEGVCACPAGEVRQKRSLKPSCMA